jgi:arylsulfatase
MMGNRAIYNDGWVAATMPPIAPWVSVPGKPVDVADYKWELYNVNKDFSQAVILAGKESAKLREMQDLFWIEAAKYNVLPLDNSKVERLNMTNWPSLTQGRSAKAPARP